MDIYLGTVKSRAVNWFTIQFWNLLVKGYSIKYPLHKQSENPWMCNNQHSAVYCLRLYGMCNVLYVCEKIDPMNR